jgi:DoxX
VQLVGGPLLALGLFTRIVAVPILIFLIVANVERWRVGRYFWNQLGLEYTTDVDDRSALFPGPRRRHVFARPPSVRQGALTRARTLQTRTRA